MAHSQDTCFLFIFLPTAPIINVVSALPTLGERKCSNGGASVGHALDLSLIELRSGGLGGA